MHVRAHAPGHLYEILLVCCSVDILLALVVSLSFTPVRSGKIGGNRRGRMDKQTGTKIKRDKGESKRERVTNPTRGTEVLIPRSMHPLLFQAKTQADACLCHAYASYFIGKCVNTMLPSLSVLSSFFYIFILFLTRCFTHFEDWALLASKYKMQRHLFQKFIFKRKELSITNYIYCVQYAAWNLLILIYSLNAISR